MVTSAVSSAVLRASGWKLATGTDHQLRLCKRKACKAWQNTRKTKEGKYYCPAHHPISAERHKRASIRGGKLSGKIRRDKVPVFKLDVEPNRASILNGFVRLANFIGDGLKKSEFQKQGLLMTLLDRMYRYATEVGGNEENNKRVADIMGSNLPDQIKLAKLVDIVGPGEALKLVPVTLDRDSKDDPSILDGADLLKNEKVKSNATITTSEALKVAVFDNMSEVSQPNVSTTVLGNPAMAGGQAVEPHPDAAPSPMPAESRFQASSAAPSPPTPPFPPPPPIQKEGKTREQIDNAECRRVAQIQAQELVTIYRRMVTGCFMPITQVMAIFKGALLEGVPFRVLQSCVLLPRSDTEQPQMLVQRARNGARQGS